MFCPQCGSTQPDELNFCKSCGANLGAVRQAVSSGQPPAKFDWTKTWVAEMLQSSEQSVRKERELELLKGITPDVVVEAPKEPVTKERPLPSADPLEDLKKDVQLQKAIEVVKGMKTADQRRPAVGSQAGAVSPVRSQSQN